MTTGEEFDKRLYTYKAKCKRIVDGDTLDLDIDLGLHAHVYERVRLFGIDTPETYGVKKDSEEYAAGMKAKNQVSEWLFPADSPNSVALWIETRKDKSGKYGRYIATVWFADLEGKIVCLNDRLVEAGLAERKEY